MSAEPHYTLYHPRWYRRRVSVWWWLQNRSYAGFVLRELTSVFVAFFAVLFHAITWFNLTPKAMVVRLGGKRVPDWVILGSNYAAWLVLSGLVAFALLRG